MNSKIVLKSGKDQSVLRLHPWVFSGAIKKTYGIINEGDLVDVYDNKDQFLGTGHYQEGSIAVRILSFQQQDIYQNFWNTKIQNAYNYRKEIGLAESNHTNTYRLVHGEGDALPGLIIDIYNDNAVMQMHSVGMYKNREQILKALLDVYNGRLKSVYNKSDATLPGKTNEKPVNEYVFGKKHDCLAKEYDLNFSIDWEEGQKTGFFIDQRENRRLLGEFSNGKSVLNMFGYTGGFSVYALRGGATLVHSVDSSKKAIELTDKNVELNFGNDPRHQSFAVDAFEFLNDINDKYDVIILDPPAFAKHNDALHNALQGYKRLNAKAFQQIRKNGVLFTFSCSQVVSRKQFREAVFSAAAMSGRHIRILHQLSQPPDHPINIYHPEGEYLKGLVLYVE